MFALAAVTALGAAGVGGGIVRLVFAATAVVTGVVYYRSSPQRYIGFTLWMWFLCPMLRRVVDMRLGYDPLSAMSVTPLAVSAIAAIGVLRRLPTLLRRSRAPFLLIGAALLYGLCVGLARNGVQAALYTLGLWVVPVLFGLDIALQWRRYGAIREAFVRFAPWGVLVAGVYGVIQWVHPWAWDVQWMVDAPAAKHLALRNRTAFGSSARSTDPSRSESPLARRSYSSSSALGPGTFWLARRAESRSCCRSAAPHGSHGLLRSSLTHHRCEVARGFASSWAASV